jgi:hypothetical protein
LGRWLSPAGWVKVLGGRQIRELKDSELKGSVKKPLWMLPRHKEAISQLNETGVAARFNEERKTARELRKAWEEAAQKATRGLII